jgi:hypothetical protein
LEEEEEEDDAEEELARQAPEYRVVAAAAAAAPFTPPEAIRSSNVMPVTSRTSFFSSAALALAAEAVAEAEKQAAEAEKDRAASAAGPAAEAKPEPQLAAAEQPESSSSSAAAESASAAAAAPQFRQPPEQPPVPCRAADLNAMFAHDPRFNCAYTTEIYQHLPEREHAHTPGANFLDRFQTCITPHMRKVVIDWMVDYHAENRLRHTTLFTAVNYLDRALELKIIVSSPDPFTALQRLGFVALRLACKFEETMYPCIENFTAYLRCSRSKIYALEFDVVKLLGWECTVCTSAHVLTRYILASNVDILPGRTAAGSAPSAFDYRKKKRVTMLLARYLCELALQAYHMLEFAPSLVAAAAVKLARRTIKVAPLWNPTLVSFFFFFVLFFFLLLLIKAFTTRIPQHCWHVLVVLWSRSMFRPKNISKLTLSFRFSRRTTQGIRKRASAGVSRRCWLCRRQRLSQSGTTPFTANTRRRVFSVLPV